MPIKRRLNTPKRKPTNAENLKRMGDLIAAGYGTEQDARNYLELQAKDNLARLQSIVATAEENRSWKFMDGNYGQAMMLYVVASVLYEKHPEHVLMTDTAFDRLARWLLKNWDNLSKDFCDWYTITAIDLEASTGYNVTQDIQVRWIVALHTGTDIDYGRSGESGGKPKTSRNGPRVLRRKAKRGSKPDTSDTGKRTRRLIRKPKRRDGS